VVVIYRSIIALEEGRLASLHDGASGGAMNCFLKATPGESRVVYAVPKRVRRIQGVVYQVA
jgi:hypothetical protein